MNVWHAYTVVWNIIAINIINDVYSDNPMVQPIIFINAKAWINVLTVIRVKIRPILMLFSMIKNTIIGRDKQRESTRINILKYL